MERTPGPWKHVQITTRDGAILRDEILTADGENLVVHDVYREGDALLIAAAPDLLTAAKVALHRLPGPLDDRDMSPAAYTFRALVKAIDKAEGRA